MHTTHKPLSSINGINLAQTQANFPSLVAHYKATEISADLLTIPDSVNPNNYFSLSGDAQFVVDAAGRIDGNGTYQVNGDLRNF